MDIKEEPLWENERAEHQTFSVDVKVEPKTEFEDEFDWRIANNNTVKKQTDNQTVAYEDLNIVQYQKCRICRRIFPNRYTLLQHNRTHMYIPLISSQETKLIYKCDYCLKLFVTKHHIQRHLLTNRGCQKKRHKKQAKCSNKEFCNKSIKNLNDCESRLSGKEQKCHICNMTFKANKYLQAHLKRHGYKSKCTKPKTFQCDQCSKIFETKILLACHITNCHSEPAQCRICKSVLKSRTYLLAHIRRVHYNDGSNHKCDVCFKEFKSPRYLNVHIKNCHSSKVKCKFCMLSFVESYISNHMKVCKYKEDDID